VPDQAFMVSFLVPPGDRPVSGTAYYRNEFNAVV
jgi:hypothetical protein